jgi:hypothetical protein
MSRVATQDTLIQPGGGGDPPGFVKFFCVLHERVGHGESVTDTAAL